LAATIADQVSIALMLQPIKSEASVRFMIVLLNAKA
jgi:hypothetical protein